MAAKRRGWGMAHEAERLSQLIYDLESATGRYMTVCLAAAEAAKNVMVGRCKVLLDVCCGE